MDIRKFNEIKNKLEININEIKNKLESNIDELSSEVEKRWKGLIGFGCGYFNGWHLEEENVCVSYYFHGNYDVDEIPIRFFEIENKEEAITQFRLYRKEEDTKEKDKQIKKKEEEEKTLLQKLKEKYEAI